MTMDANLLRTLFSYNADTGEFVRLYVPARGAKDKPTGSIANNGYLQLKIKGKVYSQHRLAWLYVYGTWPSQNIDHINGNRTDNRISNLRDVSQAVNVKNRRTAKRTNSTGVLGVTRSRRTGRFEACIRFDGRTIRIGSFLTAEDAGDAYMAAKRQYHAEAFACPHGA